MEPRIMSAPHSALLHTVQSSPSQQNLKTELRKGTMRTHEPLPPARHTKWDSGQNSHMRKRQVAGYAAGERTEVVQSILTKAAPLQAISTEAMAMIPETQPTVSLFSQTTALLNSHGPL